MNNLGIICIYLLFSINSSAQALENVLNMMEIPGENSHPYAELPKDGTGDDLSTQFIAIEVVRRPLRKKKQILDEKAQVTLSKNETPLPRIPEPPLEAIAIPQSVEIPIFPIAEVCTTTIGEPTVEKQLPAVVKAPSPPVPEKSQPTVLDKALAYTLHKMSLSAGSMPCLFFNKTAFPILGLPEAVLFQMMRHCTVMETRLLMLVCKQFAMYGQYSLLERGISLQLPKAVKTEPYIVNDGDKEAYVQDMLLFLKDYRLEETRKKIIDSICAVPVVKMREVCERILKVSGGRKMFSTELFDYLADLTMVPTQLWDNFYQMEDELYRQAMCLLKFAPSPFERAEIISFLSYVPMEFLPCTIQTTYQFYVSNTLDNQYRMKSLMVLTGGLLESQKKEMGDTFKSKRWYLMPDEIYSWALEWDHRFPAS